MSYLVKIICEESEGLWRGSLPNLPHELVSVLVLHSWLLQERTLRFHVEHAALSLFCLEIKSLEMMCTLTDVLRVDEAAISQVFVSHVLFRELQMQVCIPLLLLLHVVHVLV